MYLCNRWVVEGGARGGNVFSLARFLLQASSFPLSGQLSPAAVARDRPVGHWSDPGLYRSGFGMTSTPSIHLKKRKEKKKEKSSQVNKSIPTRQTHSLIGGESAHQCTGDFGWNLAETFLNLLMLSQKLRWKHRKNRSNLSSRGVPGSKANLPQSNHSAFALRTVK